MKKQQTNFVHLSAKLTKADMKKVLGGQTVAGEEGGEIGSCIKCSHTNGIYSGCWFATIENMGSLCERVYPGHVKNPDEFNIVTDCYQCIMN